MSMEYRALTSEEIKQRMKIKAERSKLLNSIEESIVIQLCEAGVTIREAKEMMQNIIETTAFSAGKISLIDAMRAEYEDLRSEKDAASGN